MSFHYDGPGADTEYGQKRMADDAALIGNPDRWPSFRLALKTQPWKSAELGEMRFGKIEANSLTVLCDGGPVATQTFDSLEALVREWSVD